MRVHIVGGSGSGTTTLGAALAERLGIPHFDADDYYWVRTDPPFEEKHTIPRRQERLRVDLEAGPRWILSGSILSWGDPFIPMFDLVVFRVLEAGLRMSRLRTREVERYGAERVAAGGDRHASSQSFLAWAERYDDPDFSGRSLHGHEAWLREIPCPVLRLEGDLTVDECVQRTLDAAAACP